MAQQTLSINTEAAISAIMIQEKSESERTSKWLRINEKHAEEQRNMHSQPASHHSRAQVEFMLSHKNSRLNLPCGLQDSGDCATARDTACQFVQGDVKRFLTWSHGTLQCAATQALGGWQLIASDVAFEVAYCTPFPRSVLHNVSSNNVILL